MVSDTVDRVPVPAGGDRVDGRPAAAAAIGNADSPETGSRSGSETVAGTVPKLDLPEVTEEKVLEDLDVDDFTDEHKRRLEGEFSITPADLQLARGIIRRYPDEFTLPEIKKLLTKAHRLYRRDPNFPLAVIRRIERFLGLDTPSSHPPPAAGPLEPPADLLFEMRLQAALISRSSPYAEVRSVVDSGDDPAAVSSTVRAWAIGLLLSATLALVNQLFSVRMPPVHLASNVAQLLAYPLGRAAERLAPDWGVTVAGIRHSLNPGPFTRKEHMLITIMASVAVTGPVTNLIIWVQFLPQFFGQSYAGTVGYQLLVGLSTNLVGYGMAGLCRRFLVWPAHCVWPTCLATVGLNAAFHERAEGGAVEGPFRTRWWASRLRAFAVLAGAMFLYFWAPGAPLFAALSTFNWTTWIAPTNIHLTAVTGVRNGLGFNPVPTLDWNVLSLAEDPLMVPFFTTLNRFVGAVAAGLAITGLWYTNAFHSAYLPINTNRIFDRFGRPYEVSRVVDDRGFLVPDRYRAYSPPYMSAAQLTTYAIFFAAYAATLAYAGLNHRHEIALGLRSMARSMVRWGAKVGRRCRCRCRRWRRRRQPPQPPQMDEEPDQENDDDDDQVPDGHARLMRAYPEVPQWWFTACLLVSVGLGAAGLTAYPTYTSPAVILYGIGLCVIFVVPIGIIRATTGVEIGLHVLAEFVGGALAGGNALAMNYFKAYGFVTCAHAIHFSTDLKLARYVKIPPRHAFWAQIGAAVASTVVSVGVLNYQMREIPAVCTPEARFRLICPNVHSFFAASVLWGTVGPRRMWGWGGGGEGEGEGRYGYGAALMGFPLGACFALALWGIGRARPGWAWPRQAHPVAVLAGGLIWAPFNLAYVWPTVPVAWLSWVYLRSRYLAFWARYNFVTSAAFASGIALASVVIFFALHVRGVEVDWWGNSVVRQGCEGGGLGCRRLQLAEGETFGPGVGGFH